MSCTCGATEELRPYGPGGTDICFDCAHATPEMEEQVRRAFDAQMEAAIAMSPTGGVVLGGSGGPEPLLPGDIENMIDKIIIDGLGEAP